MAFSSSLGDLWALALTLTLTITLSISRTHRHRLTCLTAHASRLTPFFFVSSSLRIYLSSSHPSATSHQVAVVLPCSQFTPPSNSNFRALNLYLLVTWNYILYMNMVIDFGLCRL
ncbi:hypothetical protein I3760_04G109900 [Carya illinoinensis]|nr:hypothetical protein I3760_04G109900 [Carya illinoinensis]